MSGKYCIIWISLLSVFFCLDLLIFRAVHGKVHGFGCTYMALYSMCIDDATALCT